MQMFRHIAEAEAEAQPKKKMALSQMEERARKMFDITSTVGLFSAACRLADGPLPPYIANIDQITLEGGGYRNADGAERFTLALSYLNPKTGVMHAGLWFSNVIVP